MDRILLIVALLLLAFVCGPELTAAVDWFVIRPLLYCVGRVCRTIGLARRESKQVQLFREAGL